MAVVDRSHGSLAAHVSGGSLDVLGWGGSVIPCGCHSSLLVSRFGHCTML